MSILSKLSSQVRERSEYSNRKVAILCLEDPSLLEEIVGGLKSKNAALLGDCAEVMTMVAVERPEWVAPFAETLTPLLEHRKTRPRWEAVHALALIAPWVPEVIAGLLPRLAAIIRSDQSVIARDYAVQAVGNYGASGKAAAEQAYPLLIEALTTFHGKQAGRALNGLAKLANLLPERQDELRAIADEYATSSRGVVRKAARALLRTVGR